MTARDDFAMQALKEASDEAGADGKSMDNTDPNEMCQCPKCGYKATESKFLLHTDNKFGGSDDAHSGDNTDTSNSEY